MTNLAKALDEYLTLRRALGFKLREASRQLPRFVQFLEDEGTSFITIELALRWAQQDPKASSAIQSDRLGMIRRFAVWRSAQDTRTQIPPPRLLPRRYTRPAPYIYSDTEVEKIVAAAAVLPSAHGLRGLTFSTLFGLLAVTGMRVGEAVALDRADVDLTAGTLLIREGKRGKSRIVPFHPSTKRILEQYSERRDAVLPDTKELAFFIWFRTPDAHLLRAWTLRNSREKITAVQCKQAKSGAATQPIEIVWHFANRTCMLRAHWKAIAAVDFFSVEVLTLTGLSRYLVFFVIDLSTRRVEIAGIAPAPGGPWMMQVARNLLDAVHGFLLGKRYLILDRDPLYTQDFRGLLRERGVKPCAYPPAVQI